MRGPENRLCLFSESNSTVHGKEHRQREEWDAATIIAIYHRLDWMKITGGPQGTCNSSESQVRPGQPEVPFPWTLFYQAMSDQPGCDLHQSLTLILNPTGQTTSSRHGTCFSGTQTFSSTPRLYSHFPPIFLGSLYPSLSHCKGYRELRDKIFIF